MHSVLLSLLLLAAAAPALGDDTNLRRLHALMTGGLQASAAPLADDVATHFFEQRLDHFALEDNRRVLPPSLLTIVLTLPPLPSPLRALDVSALSTTSPIMDELDVIVGSDAPSSHVSLGIDPIYILAVDGVLERARLGLASLSFCRICSLPLTEDAVASLGRLAPALAPGGSGALDARSCRSLNRKLRMELSTPSRLDRGSAFWDW